MIKKKSVDDRPLCNYMCFQPSEETVHLSTRQKKSVHLSTRQKKAVHPSTRQKKAVHPSTRQKKAVHPSNRQKNVYPSLLSSSQKRYMSVIGHKMLTSVCKNLVGCK